MQLSSFALTGFQFIVGAFTLFRVTFSLLVAPNLNYSVFFLKFILCLKCSRDGDESVTGLSTPTFRKKLHFKTHFLFKKGRWCLKNTFSRFIETWFENKNPPAWKCPGLGPLPVTGTTTFRQIIQESSEGLDPVLVWCRQSHLECIKSEVG